MQLVNVLALVWHGGNRLASNSLIEAAVYAKSAAKHTLNVIEGYQFNTDIPEWDDAGTLSNEERVLITQSIREVGEVMSNYVGIVRSNLRLKRAWNRLDLLYEETEELFKQVKATKDICELRNMIKRWLFNNSSGHSTERESWSTLYNRLSRARQRFAKGRLTRLKYNKHRMI